LEVFCKDRLLSFLHYKLSNYFLQNKKRGMNPLILTISLKLLFGFPPKIFQWHAE
jgi:hypothetical protein